MLRRVRVKWVLSELTLGHIWDIDLQKNQAILRDVLAVALEEFLKKVCFALFIEIHCC